MREILRLLRGDGWYVARIRGSHRQLKHPVKPALITVAGKGSADLHPKTARTILVRAGLAKESDR